MQHPEHALCCASWIVKLNTMRGKRLPEICSEGVQSQSTSILGRRFGRQQNAADISDGVLRGHRGQRTFQSVPSKDCRFCISQVGPTQTDAAEEMDGRPIGQEGWLKITKRRLKSRIAWMNVTVNSWTVEAIKK